MAKKTNIEYLRDSINNHMVDDKKEEALEFLEAVENDQDKLKDEISDLEDDNEEVNNKLLKVANRAEYSDSIDTKMGRKEFIEYSAPNLQCSTMMSELKEAIERGVSLNKIENILRAL